MKQVQVCTESTLAMLLNKINLAKLIQNFLNKNNEVNNRK